MKYLIILISLSCFGQEQIAKFSKINTEKAKPSNLTINNDAYLNISGISMSFSDYPFGCDFKQWMQNTKYKVLKVEFMCGVILVRTSFNQDPVLYTKNLEHYCKFNHRIK